MVMASIFRKLWPLLVFLSGAIKPLGAEVLGCSLNCSIKTRVGALWSLGFRVLASVNEKPGTKHATNSEKAYLFDCNWITLENKGPHNYH